MKKFIAGIFMAVVLAFYFTPVAQAQTMQEQITSLQFQINILLQMINQILSHRVPPSVLAPVGQPQINISWGNGNGNVQLALIDDNFISSRNILGYISLRNNSSGSLVWNGQSVTDLSGMQTWAVSSLSRGPFRIVAISPGPTGNYCMGSDSCNFVMSNSFHISNSVINVSLLSFSSQHVSVPAVTQPFAITFPSAGATLQAGQTYNITWTGSDPSVSSYAVYLVGGKLGYTGSTYLGTAYPRGAGNAGTFSWTVPADLYGASDYQIQFSGKGASGGNSGSFTVSGSAQNLTAPTQNGSLQSLTNTVNSLQTNIGSQSSTQSQAANMLTSIGSDIKGGDSFSAGQTLYFSYYLTSPGSYDIKYILLPVEGTAKKTQGSGSLYNYAWNGYDLGGYSPVGVLSNMDTSVLIPSDIPRGKYVVYFFIMPHGTVATAHSYAGAIVTSSTKEFTVTQTPQVSTPSIIPTVSTSNKSCPQSLTIGGTTYTLSPCSVSETMIDGQGNKNFSTTITVSSGNPLFGYSVRGYGEGFPTYGIVGAGSGGANGNTTLNLSFNDNYLSANGSQPKTYSGYLPIHIFQGSETGSDNNYLNLNLNLTVNPGTN